MHTRELDSSFFSVRRSSESKKAKRDLFARFVDTYYDPRRALGHKKVGTKYITEEGTSGFPRWQIGIGHFRFRNMTFRYHISSEIS